MAIPSMGGMAVQLIAFLLAPCLLDCWWLWMVCRAGSTIHFSRSNSHQAFAYFLGRPCEASPAISSFDTFSDQGNHFFVSAFCIVESIYSQYAGDQAAAVSTQRLHNIAGKYTGKDDPVMLVRVQKNFPATSEILAPYHIAHHVGGFMRGCHLGPLMPVRRNTGSSYFDGPPIVSASV